MIEIPRQEIARFRTVARRCVVGRPRGQAPPVSFKQTAEALTLSVRLGEVTLSLRGPSRCNIEECVVVPLGLLAEIEGSGTDSVMLQATDTGQISCRWSERGEQREVVSEAVVETEESVLSSPARLKTVGAPFLAALHECGRTTGPNPRFGLSRLQVRGKSGRVIGSDARQLLIWGGFGLPFSDDLLVAAVPVFGSREFAAEAAVRVGRTDGHLVVHVGPWTVALQVDREARYPDVFSVLPKLPGAARLHLSDVDSDAIGRVLADRPVTRSEEAGPVTIDLAPQASLSVPGRSQRRPIQVRLGRSTFAGTPLTTGIDPRHLLRALELGFRELHVENRDGAILFRDGERSYVVARQSSESQSSSDGQARPLASVRPDRSETISTPHANGRSPQAPNGSHEGSHDEIDAIAELDSLRTALTEAGRRVGRLLSFVRQFHKQRRVLQTVASQYLSRNR
jgi:hypothetical protein